MKRLLFFLVALILYAGGAWAQSRTITGRILDEAGDGFPGAQVKVVGTSVGTVTDVDGNFSLTAPESATQITITASGYADQTLGVADNLTAIRIVPTTRQLTETVVTALGIRREKKRLGYSQSDVNSEAIRRSGEQNAIQALAVKAPGVVVTQSSGTPGGSSRILMRGANTFTGENQPLVVVDGIIIDNSTTQPSAGDNPFNQNLQGVNESNRAIDINPEDIENISVLRGPAAAALYGSRGGNGAIIITTKKGRYGTGKRLGITVNSSVEVSRVNKLPEMQDRYYQGNGGVFSTFSPGPDGLAFTKDDVLGTPNSWGPRADTFRGAQAYDKYDQFFETGMAYNNSVAIDGGSEFNTFRVSFANLTNRGVIPNSKFDRTTINLNAEQKVSNWLTVGGGANYTNSRGTRVQNGSNVGGIMLTLLRAPINFNVENYYNDTTDQQRLYFGAYDNPLFTALRNPYNDYTNRIFGNVYATAQVSPSVQIYGKIGTDAYNTETRQIFDLSSPTNFFADGTGEIQYSSSNSRQLYSDFIIRYNKQLSEKFELSGLLGYNLQYNQSTFNFSRGRNIQIPELYNLSNTSELYASNSETYLRTQGVFAEMSIGYASQLFMTVTGRNDWTTGFGPNGRSLFYNKADVSWVFSELIDRNNFFSYGKIRLAYADAGTGPESYTYTRQTFFTQPFLTDGLTDGNAFPYLGQGGFAPSNIYYPGGLVPSHVIGREAGIELRFWRGRINFEGTYYHQTSVDNIIQRPIAPSTGFANLLANAGVIQNKGVELGLNVDLVKNDNWTVNVGGTFTRNRSKVLSLVEGVDEINIEAGFAEPQSFAIVGQPYGVFYGSYFLKDSASGRLLVDSLGRPIRSTDSRRIGDPNPDWIAGLFGNVTFKGLTFGMLWDIRHGGDIWNGTGARLNRIGISAASADRERKYVVDAVYAPGSTNNGQPVGGQQNTDSVTALYYYQNVVGDGPAGASENAIQDGGWVRLRQANLAYRFNFDRRRNSDEAAQPGSNSRNPLSYVEIGVTGRNLLLFTDYTGVDPETSLTGGGSNIGGYDYFNNPNTRSFIFNLRVGF